MEETNRVERKKLKKRGKEKNLFKIKVLGYAAVVLVALGIVGYGLSSNTGYVTQLPNTNDNFAACLTESGMKLYGAYWCHNCVDQKNDFGDLFHYIDYIECAEGDPEGKAQPEVCQEKGIRGYPTWITAGGERLVGRQSLQKLSEVSGCSLPS